MAQETESEAFWSAELAHSEHNLYISFAPFKASTVRN